MKANKIKLFYVNINDKISQKDYKRCMNAISKEKRDKIDSFYHYEDKRRSLYGEIMVRGLIKEVFDINSNEIVFKKNKYGKPSLLGFEKKIQFNISHSGDYVICGLCQSQVGVDIEYIDKYYDNVARIFFSEGEYAILNRLSSKKRDDMFYTLWTLKESYIKYLGRGLSVSFNSFSYERKNEEYVLDYSEYDMNIHSFSFELDGNYCPAAH